MFKLTLDCGNDAFTDSMHHEIGRILREIANKVERDWPSGPIYDANGNRCGSFELVSPYDDETE
jgi:hypothetical protein